MESLPNNGARIFLDNVLVDTITYATDGAAQHDFGNGKTALDKVPVPKGGIHTKVCRVMPIDQGTIDAYNRSVTAYNQATLTLYIALGVAAATTVITSGLAFAVVAASSMYAVWNWETARSDMYAAHAAMAPYLVC